MAVCLTVKPPYSTCAVQPRVKESPETHRDLVFAAMQPVYDPPHYAKSFAGFSTRILPKMTALTLIQWLNQRNGNNMNNLIIVIFYMHYGLCNNQKESKPAMQKISKQSFQLLG